VVAVNPDRGEIKYFTPAFAKMPSAVFERGWKFVAITLFSRIARSVLVAQALLPYGGESLCSVLYLLHDPLLASS
jgi:hypothetical protein